MGEFDSGFGKFADYIRGLLETRGSAAAPPLVNEVLRVSYLASLSTEEKHATQFTVVCCDQARALRGGRNGVIDHWDQWDFSTFEKTRPCTPHEIRKLSSALDPDEGALLVWVGPNEKGIEVPVIWGIARFCAHEGMRLTRDGWPKPVTAPCLRISARKPGSLRVDDLLGLLAEFNGDTFEESVRILGQTFRPVRVYVDAMSKAAREVALDRLDFRKPQPNPPTWTHVLVWDELYIAVLQSVLVAMREHGRGGTLLLVNDEHEAATKLDGHSMTTSFYEGKRQDTGLATLQSRFFKYLIDLAADECMMRNPVPAPCLHGIYGTWRELQKAAAFVGRLTGADGAVLMTPDFRVLRFAAKIKTDDSLIDVMRGSDYPNRPHRGFTASRYEQESRGTRFKSAAWFVHKTDGSVAFVASSDGPVTALCRDGEFTFAWDPVSIEIDDNVPAWRNRGR